MPATASSPSHQPVLALRPADPDDVAIVARLAALDEAPIPVGDLLLGLLDGEPVAVLAIASGDAVADPFVPSLEVVELLRTRADRLRGHRHPAARRFLHRLGQGERRTAAWVG